MESKFCGYCGSPVIVINKFGFAKNYSEETGEALKSIVCKRIYDRGFLMRLFIGLFERDHIGQDSSIGMI
jgi:hypothetical protein